MKEKKYMFMGEFTLKKTAKTGPHSLFVILPKDQLKKNGLKDGDDIILEAYKWENE
jgi:hypothetical protein